MVSTRGAHEPKEDGPPLKRLDSTSSQDSTATNEEPVRKSRRLREKADKHTDKVSPGGASHDSDEENQARRTGIPAAPARFPSTTSTGVTKIPHPTRRGRVTKKPEPEVVTILSTDEEGEVDKKEAAQKTPEAKKTETAVAVKEEKEEGKSSRRSSIDEPPKTRRASSRPTTPARATGTPSAKKAKISDFFAASPPPQEENATEEKEVVEEETKKGRRSRANTPAKTPAKSKVSTLVIEDIEVEPHVSEREKSAGRATRATSRAREEFAVAKEDQEPKTPKRGRKQQQPAILQIEDIEVDELPKKEEEAPAKTTRATRSSSRSREQASPARSTRGTTPARKEQASPTRLTRAMRKAGMTTPGQEEPVEEPAKFEVAPEQAAELDNECEVIEKPEDKEESNDTDTKHILSDQMTKESQQPLDIIVHDQKASEETEAPVAQPKENEVAVEETEEPVAETKEKEVAVKEVASPEPTEESQKTIEKEKAPVEEEPIVLPEGPSTARRRDFDTLADRLISQLYTPKKNPAKAALPSLVQEASTPIPGQGNSSFMDWEACPTPKSVHSETTQLPAAIVYIGSADLAFEKDELVIEQAPAKEESNVEDEAADEVLRKFKEKKRRSGDISTSVESIFGSDESKGTLEQDLDISDSTNQEDSRTGEAESVTSSVRTEHGSLAIVDESSRDSEGGYITIEEETEKTPDLSQEVVVTVNVEISRDLVVDEVVVGEKATDVAEMDSGSNDSQGKSAEKTTESPAPRAKIVDDLSSFLDVFQQQDSPAPLTAASEDAETRKLMKGKSVATVVTRKEAALEPSVDVSVEKPVVEEKSAPKTPKDKKHKERMSEVLTPLSGLAEDFASASSQASQEIAEVVEESATQKAVLSEDVVVEKSQTASEVSVEFTVTPVESTVAKETVFVVAEVVDVSEPVELEGDKKKKKKKRQSMAPSVDAAPKVTEEDFVHFTEEFFAAKKTELEATAAESSEFSDVEEEKKQKKKKRQSTAPSASSESVVHEEVSAEAEKTEPVVEVIEQEDEEPKKKKKKRQSIAPPVETNPQVVSEVTEDAPAPVVPEETTEAKKTESETSIATAVETPEVEGEHKKKKKKRQSTAPSASLESVVSHEEVPAEAEKTEVPVTEPVVETVELRDDEPKKKKKRQSMAASLEADPISEVPEEPLAAPVTEEIVTESETPAASAVESSESVDAEKSKKKKKKRQSVANTTIFLGDDEDEQKSNVASEVPAEVTPSDIPVLEMSEEVEAIAKTPKDKKKKKKKLSSLSNTTIFLGDEEEVVAEVIIEEEKKKEVAETPVEETSGVEKKKKKRKKSIAVDSSEEVQEEIKKAKLDVQEPAAEVEEPVKEKKKKKKQKRATVEEADEVEEAIVPEVEMVEEKETVEEEADAKKIKKKKKKGKKMVVAPEEEVETEEAASGAVNYPELSFKKLYAEPELCSSKISAALSALYTWSCQQKRQDDLPDTFLNNDDETVYQFVNHKGKQIKKDFRKFKSLLDDPIACPFLEDGEEENDDEQFDQDIEDEEEMDLEDEAFAGDEEEEDEVDLFNLRGEDLKDLERELAEMDNEDDDEAGTSSDKENGEEKPKKQQKKFPKSVVDDKFFNLAEMDAFCDDQEKQNDDEGILATVDDSWGGPADYHYEDFFGKLDDVVGEDTSAHKKTKKRKAEDSDSNLRKKKSVRFAMDEEEEQEEQDEEMDENEEPEEEAPVLLGKAAEEEKVESKLKADIRKLKESIRQLEQENLEPRSWELSGEVTAQQRGENALLDTHVQFDNTSKRAPEVTEDFTEKLEALIKQRIKDQAFDDVVRIKKVDEKVDVYRNDAIEEMENMKKSLSEVYEKEYQKAAGQVEAAPAENEQHKAIQTKVDRLFQMIDAMSHFEYTPPQVRPEIRVVSNMPALRVEEVGMMASTDAQLLAPEEMKKKQKGDLKADEERTSTDKLRQRRKKKVKQRAMVLTMGADKALAGQIEKKIKKKAKKTAGGADKHEESMKSTNFFSKLQDTVQKELKQKSTKKTKKVKSEKTTVGGAKFKL